MSEARPGIRLYVEDDLSAGGTIGVGAAQAHYLANVMRLRRGDSVALFNGRDGEWTGRIDGAGRGWCSLAVDVQAVPQQAASDLWLVFAPVKRARLDYIAAKATELGVARVWPVITRHTNISRVNTERLRANAVEAAEQCGRMDVPSVTEPTAFADLLANWPGDRHILLCDETGQGTPVAEALSGAPAGPWAVMTGPEGGFAAEEIAQLKDLSCVTPVSLGPRILRADTAAVAALACWQAWLGDWSRAGAAANVHVAAPRPARTHAG